MLSPEERLPRKVVFRFRDIEEVIHDYHWFPFQTKLFDCPNLTQDILDFYDQHHELPPPCSECYKALIFWENDYSEQNVRQFFSMLESFKLSYSGKLNQLVVVFYFKTKPELDAFIEYLRSEMTHFRVKGTIQWRRACKQFQRLKPELWKDAKTFLPERR